MTTKFGPWIRYDGFMKPWNLKDDQMIEAVFINSKGVLKTDSFTRPANLHCWEGTLAYRVEQVETTIEVFGNLCGVWVDLQSSEDTHKITYTVDQDGNVLSCKMEKL